MNWDYWLPWRSTESESKDLDYEKRVKDDCVHDWEWTDAEDPREAIHFEEATLEHEYVVVPTTVMKELYCQKCGEFGGEMSTQYNSIAFEADFRLDEGTSISDAIVEPVSADYTATEDGDVEAVDDEPDRRVLVSEDADTTYEVTD